jgi:hypothetical protein
MAIDRDEVVRLTEEYGGQWGINHTRRLLQLMTLIGEGRTYNVEATWLAAHLHDWGGYTPWAQNGVDHAVRSKQVAEVFLTDRAYPPELDVLGVVGVLRDFSKNTKDLRKAYDITRRRRAELPGMLCLDKSKELAAKRLQQMDELYAAFGADSFGCF